MQLEVHRCITYALNLLISFTFAHPCNCALFMHRKVVKILAHDTVCNELIVCIICGGCLYGNVPQFVKCVLLDFYLWIFTSARGYCNLSCLLVLVLVCSFVNVLEPNVSKMAGDKETRSQWNTYGKWHMGNQMVEWSTASRDPLRAGGVARAWRRLQFLAAYLV